MGWQAGGAKHLTQDCSTGPICPSEAPKGPVWGWSQRWSRSQQGAGATLGTPGPKAQGAPRTLLKQSPHKFF